MMNRRRQRDRIFTFLALPVFALVCVLLGSVLRLHAHYSRGQSLTLRPPVTALDSRKSVAASIEMKRPGDQSDHSPPGPAATVATIPDAGRALGPNSENQRSTSTLFMSIGDWGGITKVSLAVSHQMAMYAASHRGTDTLRFLLSVGDNFYDDGVSSVTDPQWNGTFRRLLGTHNVPVYSCLGNHDHHGSSAAQVAYSDVDPLWVMPRPFYRVALPLGTLDYTADLFVLDTYAPKGLTQQLEWLDAAMANSSAHWRLVMNHNPIFSGGSTHGATTGFGRWSAMTRTLKNKLLPILLKHRAHAMFSGDDHTLQVLESNGTAFFVSGAGGGRQRGMFHRVRSINGTQFNMQSVGGFMAHHLDASQLRTVVVSFQGKELYSHVLKHPSAREED
eukprot:NODE_1908_length_1360_cov_38.017544_g1728_i0.p1 GENE.NODE_1908_length_1360_cov_38.017544_g1728_i0~~NODE_1908_length_1360_cov_38.017544_g1728_i0.p1  ORF type:complete len:390 (+),score=57.99 NODE_1908_length_1360_cov_38.017544_g1728_i0:93-1262(+)